MGSQNIEFPLVSIGLPVYNGEKYVKQAVESLLAQTYVNFELIISDNCSTDDTWNICQSYASQDGRIQLCRNAENVGPAENFKKVLTMANGDYFMWAAHDDWWNPDFIDECLKRLLACPKAILCYPFFERENMETEEIAVIDPNIETNGCCALRRFSMTILQQNTARAIYGLTRTEFLKKTNFRPYNFGSDRAVLDQLSILGEFVCVPRVLVRYRWVPNKSDAYLAWQIGMTQKKEHPYARKTSELNAVLIGVLHCAHITQLPLLLIMAYICYWKRYGAALRSEWYSLFRSLIHRKKYAIRET